MGEGGALSLFRFHLSPFPQKRLILRLLLRELRHNCFPQAAQAPVGVVLCGKILRNLKMAVNNIKKDFGKNLYGIWSLGNRFL